MSNPAATFAFADIAGFTALTEAHGDEAAFALVSDFTNAVRAELDSVQGEHVKTIGDALMLRIPDRPRCLHHAENRAIGGTITR
jgi:adenylate cyclase